MKSCYEKQQNYGILKITKFAKISKNKLNF